MVFVTRVWFTNHDRVKIQQATRLREGNKITNMTSPSKTVESWPYICRLALTYSPTVSRTCIYAGSCAVRGTSRGAFFRRADRRSSQPKNLRIDFLQLLLYCAVRDEPLITSDCMSYMHALC
jgi:hypothetical protein